MYRYKVVSCQVCLAYKRVWQNGNSIVQSTAKMNAQQSAVFAQDRPHL